jgi:hypothetical protein
MCVLSLRISKNSRTILSVHIDAQLLFGSPDGGVLRHDFFTNKTETLLTPEDEPRLATSFLQQLSADGEFLLIGFDYQKVRFSKKKYPIK